MRRLGLVKYPATFMVLLAAVYVLVRVTPGDRSQVFAVLALTAVGATEVVFGAVGVARRRETIRVGILRTAGGVGAATMGFALLDPYKPIVLAAGCILFALGLITTFDVWARAR